jgi:hypothetical protein
MGKYCVKIGVSVKGDTVQGRYLTKMGGFKLALKDIASKPKPKGKKGQDPKLFMHAVQLPREYQAKENECKILMDKTDTEYNRANFIMGAYDQLLLELKPKARAKTNSKKVNSRKKK